MSAAWWLCIGLDLGPMHVCNAIRALSSPSSPEPSRWSSPSGLSAPARPWARSTGAFSDVAHDTVRRSQLEQRLCDHFASQPSLAFLASSARFCCRTHGTSSLLCDARLRSFHFSSCSCWHGFLVGASSSSKSSGPRPSYAPPGRNSCLALFVATVYAIDVHTSYILTVAALLLTAYTVQTITG